MCKQFGVLTCKSDDRQLIQIHVCSPRWFLFSQVSWGTQKDERTRSQESRTALLGDQRSADLPRYRSGADKAERRPTGGAEESEAGAQDHAADKIQPENVAMLARDHGSTGKIINAHEAQLFHTPIGA